MKRQRGRGRKPGGGGGGNHGNRPHESNGPDVKIRGTAAQIYEKYMQYARDAQSGGDRVKYENYLQHAEHYYRVMAATMPRERLLQQQEGGFGQQGQAGEAQGNFGQQPQGIPQGGQAEGGEQADPMKVMDAEGGADEDDVDFEGDEAEAAGEENEGGGEEFRAEGGQQQSNQGGGREGRGRRRRGRRGRHHDGPGGGEGPGGGGGGGNGGGGSALDSLARRQGAMAGG